MTIWMQARFADLRTEAPPASEQQAEIDAQRGALEADVAALKQEYARLQRERSQLQGDVQVCVCSAGPGSVCGREAGEVGGLCWGGLWVATRQQRASTTSCRAMSR